MKVLRNGKERDIKSVWYDRKRNEVCYIDQRKLPFDLEIYRATSLEENVRAIREMVVRGAPAIGMSAAWTLCQAAVNGKDLDDCSGALLSSRPTARDLSYYVELITAKKMSVGEILEYCLKLERDQIERCKRIGLAGEELIEDGSTLLTHCNAGALATVDWGTALAPMRAARSKSVDFHVLVDETRPRLQGAKLTAWELEMEGIPYTVIADNAAGYYMKKGEVDLVITGADRITSKGYVANKIGTYEKAVVAKENGVPFYVAAPVSTFDLNMDDEDQIPIEMRGAEEMKRIEGVRIFSEDAPTANPAFDVTPARYISGYITENGILAVDEIKAFGGSSRP